MEEEDIRAEEGVTVAEVGVMVEEEEVRRIPLSSILEPEFLSCTLLLQHHRKGIPF